MSATTELPQGGEACLQTLVLSHTPPHHKHPGLGSTFKMQKPKAAHGKTSASLTWMRHLLTSLAQRALLQPEVRDNIERRKRRTATAGRISSPGLILTAHQQGTGKSPTSMRDTAQDLGSGMED